jgi:hypothetical protein
MATTVVALLLWIAAAMRIWRAWQKRHAAGLRAIAIALVAIAVAATVNIPDVAKWVDNTSGWPNVADLIKQIAIVGAACGNQVMLLHLQTPPGENTPDAGRIRVRWTAAAAVAGLSLLLFLIGGRHHEAGALFARVYAGTPWLSESRLVVTIYAAVILSLVVRLCLKQWDRSALGRGVLLLASGASVMVIYCVARAIFLVGHRLGYAVPNAVFDFGTRCVQVGLPLVAIGTLLPAFETWLRARRDLAGLGPLWDHLAPTMPMVGGGEPPRHAELSLFADHRVVKVQDGLYLLAQLAGMPAGTGSLSRDRNPPDDAEAIALWLRIGTPGDVTLAMLATPVQHTDRSWCVLVARSFAQTAPRKVPVT